MSASATSGGPAAPEAALPRLDAVAAGPLFALGEGWMMAVICVAAGLEVPRVMHGAG